MLVSGAISVIVWKNRSERVAAMSDKITYRFPVMIAYVMIAICCGNLNAQVKVERSLRSMLPLANRNRCSCRWTGRRDRGGAKRRERAVKFRPQLDAQLVGVIRQERSFRRGRLPHEERLCRGHQNGLVRSSAINTPFLNSKVILAAKPYYTREAKANVPRGLCRLKF